MPIKKCGMIYFALLCAMLFLLQCADCKCCRRTINWIYKPHITLIYVKHSKSFTVCDNEKVVQAWECCSKGRCNIFCCDCEKRCLRRHDPRSRTGLMEEDDNNEESRLLFLSLDRDKDKHLSFAEVAEYVNENVGNKSSSISSKSNTIDRANVRPVWFEELDADGDGRISPFEFDPDLEI